YEVLKVIPHYLIVLNQPTPDKNDVGHGNEIGLGEVPAGFHVFALEKYNSKTLVTCFGDHASLMARAGERMSFEEAAEPFRALSEGAGEMWREFIPNLRKVVQQAGS